MSYDIYLEIDTGAGNHVEVFWWNYTMNCAAMWRHAGMDPRTWSGRLARDITPELETAHRELQNNPDYYRGMDPSNGYGSYDSLIVELGHLLVAMIQHPNTTVRVSR